MESRVLGICGDDAQRSSGTRTGVLWDLLFPTLHKFVTGRGALIWVGISHRDRGHPPEHTLFRWMIFAAV